MAETDTKTLTGGQLKIPPANLLPSASGPAPRARRTLRISLNIPIIVSGETEAGVFREESRTLNVNVHGGLISLATKVVDAQLITLTNCSTSEQQMCRVIRVMPTPEGILEAGVEFTQPAANFWRVSFPPADWTRVEEIRKPEPLLPWPRNHVNSQGRHSTPAAGDQARPTYAGLLPRLAAGFIDILILAAILGAGGALGNLIVPGGGVISRNGASDFVIVILLNVIYLYFTLMESSPWQATFGKKTLRLYVTDLTGVRMTISRAAGRTFAKYLTGMTLGIGYIICAFTEQKQALHDTISRSLVLRRP
jgi:uncharacterized RDD family membrane protein YckC